MKLKICVLEKKRGNFVIHEKFAKGQKIVDTTSQEVEHHLSVLKEAGYEVTKIKWSDNILTDLKNLNPDLVFNISSIVETAMLEELAIPYVGSDIFGCVIATDKVLTKNIWLKNNLPTSPFVLARSLEDLKIFEKSPPFNFPLFIKPSQGRGSSGIDNTSLINSYEELVSGVEKRLNTIKQPVLIERFLDGREVSCGVIGNGDTIRALPLLEIIHEGNDKFLTFDKKEMDDDIFQCPAQLSQEYTISLKNLAIMAYKSVGIRDYGRIDIILTDEGPFLLEINSFAGLMCTPIEKPHSYMGFMAKAAKKQSSEFLNEIVKEALNRIEQEK